MKRAALRYAEILEKGAWVTHQEQDEIAKLLRRLVMTEAWDTSDMAHRTGNLNMKQEPMAVLKVWDEKEQKHVFMNYHLTQPSKPWIGLDNSDLQYQTPHDVITMRYAEALLKEKNK